MPIWEMGVKSFQCVLSIVLSAPGSGKDIRIMLGWCQPQAHLPSTLASVTDSSSTNCSCDNCTPYCFWICHLQPTEWELAGSAIHRVDIHRVATWPPLRLFLHKQHAVLWVVDAISQGHKGGDVHCPSHPAVHTWAAQEPSVWGQLAGILSERPPSRLLPQRLQLF